MLIELAKLRTEFNTKEEEIRELEKVLAGEKSLSDIEGGVCEYKETYRAKEVLELQAGPRLHEQVVTPLNQMQVK